MPDSDRFVGKVALVTGAGSGIGECTAKAFAAEGADVVILDIDGGGAQRVAKEICAAGGRAVARHGDVRVSDDCRDAVRDALERFGGLDIVFCNAGVYERGTAVSQTEQEWDLQVDTLLKGTFLTCKHAIPALQARGGGAIVLSGSNCSHIGCGSRFAYTAAKAAMPVLAKQLSNDYFHNAKIRTNCVSPGLVQTAMTERTWRQLTGSPDGTALPNDVAATWQRAAAISNAVLFLAGPEAADITGVTIPVSRTALLRVAGMRTG